MPKKEIQDKTFNFSIKTIATIGTVLCLMIGEYIVLHEEINKAMDLPKPEVTKTEFEYQIALTSKTIESLQKDIDNLKIEQNNLKQIIYNLK